MVGDWLLSRTHGRLSAYAPWLVLAYPAIWIWYAMWHGEATASYFPPIVPPDGHGTLPSILSVVGFGLVLLATTTTLWLLRRATAPQQRA